MNINMMNEAVRISDRFSGNHNAESIQRQGRLANMLVTVFIFHSIIGIAFLKMDEYERSHRRLGCVQTEITFDLQEPRIQTQPVIVQPRKVPDSVVLNHGKVTDSGAASSRARESHKVITMPTPTAETREPRPAPTAVASQQIATAVAQPTPTVQKTNPEVRPVQAPNLGSSDGAATTAPPSGAPITGGTPNASNGRGVDRRLGDGGDGEATTPGDHGLGDGIDIIGQKDPPVAVAVTPPKIEIPRLKRNIAPFRNEVVKRIAENWHAPGGFKTMTVSLTLGRDGALLNAEVITSSGRRKWDIQAIQAIERTDYPAMPAWYTGDDLTILLVLEAE